MLIHCRRHRFKQMKLYHYPNCSTCKQAIKYLRERGVEPELINIAEQVPDRRELSQMLEIYAGDIKKLFNTSGLQYRELNIKDRLVDCSPQDALDLLASNGMLIKRPFLISTDRPQADPKGAVGFNAQGWEALLT